MDDRYAVSPEEREKIIKGAFQSLEPLVLKAIPPKQKKKAVILERIAEELEPGHRYTEKEINELLKAIHSDYVFLRRYLIEFGFMDRERNCSFYWKKG